MVVKLRLVKNTDYVVKMYPEPLKLQFSLLKGVLVYLFTVKGFVITKIAMR